MKPRKLMLYAVVVLMVLALASTGFARDDKPAKGMYFRLVTHGGNDPFWAVFQQGMRDAADLIGCRADIDLCGSDQQLMARRFQEATAMRPDGIALVINDSQMWDRPVTDAIGKGINVIGVNNDDQEGSRGNARLCYIGQDERRAGLMIGRAVFEAAKKAGKNMRTLKVAAAVEVPGANYGVVRSQGIKDAMAEYGIPGDIEIIDATLEMTTAESRITSYIIGHSDLNCLFGLGGITTDRITASLRNAKKRPGEIVAGGFDATPGTLTGLKTGYMVASIDQQQYLQGYFAVMTLYLMKAYGFAPNIDTGGYLITKDNIDQIEKLSPQHIR
ncbi:MAG: substrate-binding domain-containing protein [Spirochaetota bacterium]